MIIAIDTLDYRTNTKLVYPMSSSRNQRFSFLLLDRKSCVLSVARLTKVSEEKIEEFNEILYVHCAWKILYYFSLGKFLAGNATD